jgi:hypothetical protein
VWRPNPRRNSSSPEEAYTELPEDIFGAALHRANFQILRIGAKVSKTAMEPQIGSA